jgi:zinc transporter ZupT
MDVSRKLGILVLCAVPAIIGGGIVYALFDNYISVFIYETLLLFAAGGVVAK